MDWNRFYDTLTGCRKEEPGYAVRSAFDAQCEAYYSSILEAGMRINQAIRGEYEPEDPDVSRIQFAYERITELLCKAAFSYGAQYGRGEIEL